MVIITKNDIVETKNHFFKKANENGEKMFSIAMIHSGRQSLNENDIALSIIFFCERTGTILLPLDWLLF